MKTKLNPLEGLDKGLEASKMTLNLASFPMPTFSFHFKEANSRNHQQCFQGMIYREKITRPLLKDKGLIQITRQENKSTCFKLK